MQSIENSGILAEYQVATRHYSLRRIMTKEMRIQMGEAGTRIGHPFAFAVKVPKIYVQKITPDIPQGVCAWDSSRYTLHCFL
jgi:hypothetical protein